MTGVPEERGSLLLEWIHPESEMHSVAFAQLAIGGLLEFEVLDASRVARGSVLCQILGQGADPAAGLPVLTVAPLASDSEDALTWALLNCASPNSLYLSNWVRTLVPALCKDHYVHVVDRWRARLREELTEPWTSGLFDESGRRTSGVMSSQPPGRPLSSPTRAPPGRRAGGTRRGKRHRSLRSASDSRSASSAQLFREALTLGATAKSAARVAPESPPMVLVESLSPGLSEPPRSSEWATMTQEELFRRLPAVYTSWCHVRVAPILKGGEGSQRCEREVRTLCEIIESLLDRNVMRSLSVALERLNDAVDTTDHDGST